MTIRQWDRREELRRELLDLIVEMMALGRTAEGQNTPEFRRLDQELTEKNAELEALNALCSDPNELRELKYRRSVRENHDFLRVIQIFLIVGLFACLFFFIRGTARKRRNVGYYYLRTPLHLCLHRMGHLHSLPVQAGIDPSTAPSRGRLFLSCFVPPHEALRRPVRKNSAKLDAPACLLPGIVIKYVVSV